MTKVAEMQSYNLMSDIYNRDNDTIDWTHQSIANMTKMEFYKLTAHDVNDFIIR